MENMKSAEGMIGMLINNVSGMVFRVPVIRGGEPTYDDYKIGHPDMVVQIIESDAKIFPSDDKNYVGIIDMVV